MDNNSKIAKARTVLKLSKEAKKLMKEERSGFVLDLMLKEYRSNEIEQLYTAKFNETSRNARNYIKKVKDTLKKEATAEKTGKVAKAVKQYEMIYRQLLEAGKIVEAAQVLEKKIKLEGLEAPKQTINVTHTISTNNEDQFKHLSLEQKLNIAKMLKPSNSENESGTGGEVIE